MQVGGAGTTFSTPGMAADSSGDLQVLAEGPANTVYAYWNVNAQFFGPLQIGGPNSTFSGPDVGVSGCDDSTFSFLATVQGRNHDVEEYVRSDLNVWSGAIDIGTDGTVFSAPTHFPGTCRATFEGPNHTLYDATGGSRPHASVQVRGGGTTYSQPSEINNPLNDPGPTNRDIAVEGPSNTLSYYQHDVVTRMF